MHYTLIYSPTQHITIMGWDGRREGRPLLFSLVILNKVAGGFVKKWGVFFWGSVGWGMVVAPPEGRY